MPLRKEIDALLLLLLLVCAPKIQLSAKAGRSRMMGIPHGVGCDPSTFQSSPWGVMVARIGGQGGQVASRFDTKAVWNLACKSVCVLCLAQLSWVGGLWRVRCVEIEITVATRKPSRKRVRYLTGCNHSDGSVNPEMLETELLKNGASARTDAVYSTIRARDGRVQVAVERMKQQIKMVV